METKPKTETINYMILGEAFAKAGWTRYPQFMAGSRWVKGGDTVTSYYGKYKLNGQPISKEQLIRMLQIGASCRWPKPSPRTRLVASTAALSSPASAGPMNIRVK